MLACVVVREGGGRGASVDTNACKTLLLFLYVHTMSICWYICVSLLQSGVHLKEKILLFS